MDSILQAVANANRRRILHLVWSEELSSRQIAERFDISWPAISQNLRVLKEAGLVIERREGTQRLYRAHRKALKPLETLLRDMWRADLETLRGFAEREHRARRRQT